MMRNHNRSLAWLLVLVFLPGVAAEAPIPARAAESYLSALTIKADTGEAVFEENAADVAYPASLDKLMMIQSANDLAGAIHSTIPSPTPDGERVLLAYYPCWNSGYRSDRIPYRKLTHICHAFVQPQADGSLLAPAGPPAFLEPELLTEAHAAGLSVLVSVGGYDPVADASFRTIAADPGLRAAFAGHLETFCRTHGYNGADLDWEFPADAADRDNQNLLFREIRETFNSASEPAPSWLLTMAIPAGDWHGRWNDYTALGEYVDFYNLMAYDGHGGWSGHMGHNAPLYQGGDPFDDVSVKAALDYNLLTRSIPPEKLILGLPFYGYRWPAVETLYEACSPCEAGQEAYHEIAPLIGDGWTRIWDLLAEVPYLTADGGPGVISYDDVQSIEAKVEYAFQDRGLGGVFVWEISGDYLDGEQPLLDRVYLAVRGAGTADLGVFRPATGLWAIRKVTRVYFGGEGDLPVPGDYTGNGVSDFSIFRPASGLWAVREVTRVYFGRSGDIPVPGDYGGEGSTRIGIFRPGSGLWLIRNLTRAYFGRTGDLPVLGNYDGTDGQEIAVFRPTSGLWAIRGLTRLYYGRPGDIPVPGEYSGTGTAIPAIFRPASGHWAVRGLSRFYFGRWGDTPSSADYRGDGTDHPGVFRSSSGLWAIRGLTRVYHGSSGDLPVTP